MVLADSYPTGTIRRLKIGYASYLTLLFSDTEDAPALWIQSWGWRIERGGRIVAGGDDHLDGSPSAHAEQQLVSDNLRGAAVERCMLDPLGIDTRWFLSNGCTVVAFGSVGLASSDSGYWTFFRPDGGSLSLLSGRRLRTEVADGVHREESVPDGWCEAVTPQSRASEHEQRPGEAPVDPPERVVAVECEENHSPVLELASPARRRRLEVTGLWRLITGERVIAVSDHSRASHSAFASLRGEEVSRWAIDPRTGDFMMQIGASLLDVRSVTRACSAVVWV